MIINLQYCGFVNQIFWWFGNQMQCPIKVCDFTIVILEFWLIQLIDLYNCVFTYGKQ